MLRMTNRSFLTKNRSAKVKRPVQHLARSNKARTLAPPIFLINKAYNTMRIFITAFVLIFSLSACDSEGIDRNPGVSDSLNNADVNPVNDDSVTTDPIDSPVANPTDDDNSDPVIVQPVTPDPTNDGDDANDGAVPVNPFGGSGSSDGGNTDNTPDNTDTDASDIPQNDAAPPVNTDATLDTSAPSSGTTFVSTMSPIQSETGPLCLQPSTDAGGNVIMNAQGNCPVLQFHGNLAFGDFLLATNAWNFCASSLPDWEQCISVAESDGKVAPRWDYDWGNESDVNGAVWLVKSYPEIIYGIKSPGEYSGSTLAETPAETGLPARVSDLPFFKIDYSFSSDEYPTRGKDFNGVRINGERNVAVESFFHELSGDCQIESLVRNGSSSNQRYEIMVWLDSGAERLPAAPQDFVTTQTLDGKVYDIYTKPSDPEYIAFVAQNPTASGEINWTTFIEWTRTYAHRVNEVFGRGSDTVVLQDSWCMANILLGTEIWWGEGFFQADEWTIHRTVR